MPPDAHPGGERLTDFFQSGFEGAQLGEILALFEQMDNFHPDEPCWHLTFVAVDPAQQNNGYGSALLEYALKIIDQDKNLAYLEFTNEANLTLYKRHGFELMGKIQAGN